MNELTLKVEQEKTSDGENKTRVNPVLTLAYKGAYWNAGAKRSVEESNEAGKNSKTTDAYFVELFVKPGRATLPDLKAKYNLDQDFEKDTTDTSKHAITASSVYNPMAWIQICQPSRSSVVTTRFNSAGVNSGSPRAALFA